MGVTDGQPVNAATTNPAFLDANNDDTALGKITLNNISDPTVSGPQVINIQRELNSLASWVGKATGIAYNATPGWTNNQVGGPTDSTFVRVDTLTARFSGSVGHTHDGTDGQGPLLSGSVITNVPFKGYFQQGTDLSGVTGLSSDLSAQFVAKSVSTSSVVLGVISTPPFNKTVLRYASGANQGDKITDASGNVVYGRITNTGGGGGTWTMSYFTDSAGAESAYTFASATDISWYYQEIFNPMTATPVYSELAVIPSDNATADIVDASETQAGKVFLANAAPGAIAATGAKGSSVRAAKMDHTHEGVHSIMIDGDVTQTLGDVTLKAGTGITLAWVAGKLQITGSASSSAQVEYRTVTGTEATNKQLTLVGTPAAAATTVVDVIGVGPQFYSDDFTVSGTTLSWSALGMDSLPIVAGDKLRIVYWT